MTLATRPMRHGLYTGRPAVSVGQHVDLTGRATGRPMCCHVQKMHALALTCFFCIFQMRVFVFLFVFPCGFRGTAFPAHDVHIHYEHPHNSAPPTAHSDGFCPDWLTTTSFCCCDAPSSSNTYSCITHHLLSVCHGREQG